jgi:integrase
LGRRGRGEGLIHRRTDGRWEARVDLGWHDGKRVRRSMYGVTRQDVARRLAATLREQQLGLLQMGPSQRLDAYLDQWLKTAKPGLAPKSYIAYEMYLRRHIIPELGNLRLDKLNPEHVEALLTRKLEEGLAPQSVVHIRGVLRRALGRAVRFGLLGPNVAALTDPPRMQRREMAAMTPEQARAFLDAIGGDRLEALYLLALTTGMRQGELLGLRWPDVDLDGGELRVVHALQRLEGALRLVNPKTAKSRRSVTLPAITVEALRRHHSQQAEVRLSAGVDWKDAGFVFCTSSGRPLEPRNVTRSFQRFLKRSGLMRMRFHDLRHSFATLLLIQGLSPRVVMEMLGHSQITLTMNTYSHVIPALQREAASKLDALLRGSG